MNAFKDLMIDKMNADRETEASAKKIVKVCKNCSYFYDDIPCPESKGENDSCEYFSS
jgi:hypothetical protein